MMNSPATIIFTIALMVSFSRAIEFDHCVSDISLPRGPSGYACKDRANVIADDFVFSGFRGEKTTENMFGLNVTRGFLDQFPGLNGLGIAMARLDFGVGGHIPLHSHRTSEVIVVIKGTIIAGFIDTTNVAYYTTLEVGDMMVFPQAMLHFQVNNGTTPALAFVALNGGNPGVQFPTGSLFDSNLPSDLAEKVTLFSHEEVMRMKRLFGIA